MAKNGLGIRDRERQESDDKCINSIKKLKANNCMNNGLNEMNAELSQYLPPIHRLSLDFFRRKSCISLSKALLGQIFCRRLSDRPNQPILRGKIVETEAYLGIEDKASHTYGGRRTERNEPMFMCCGTCYVYFTYGMYHCFNVSAQGEGAAVLLRAVEPLEGIDWMQRLRAESTKGCKQRAEHKEYKLKMLANGPSKLCMAFGINKSNTNKVHITDSPWVWIEKGDTVCSNDMVSAKRIGISGADEWTDKELRFYMKDCPFVSRK